MNRRKFISRAKRYGRRKGEPVNWSPGRGKGSHGLLTLGDRTTTVKDGELSPRYVKVLLRQLRIHEEEF